MNTLRIPKSVTKQHIVFIGTTGTGKTQGMMQLFDNLPNSKKVITDVKGDYTSIYYKDEDYIFCPLDKRSIQWNIFNDVESYNDVSLIANALIPENPKTNDPYWDNAARNIVEAVLLYLTKHFEKPNNKNLWEHISSFEKIVYIKENDEECKALLDFYIDVENQKHTREVLGTVISKSSVKNLKLLSDMDGDFSFKKWIENNDLKNNIFMLSNPEIIDIVMPIYRVGIELMAGKLLSMEDSNEREIYFWLDEFPRLNKLKKIIDVFTLARSKGGRVVYSFQEFGDLETIYGREQARVIISNTNTLFLFRTINAEYFENILGKQEVLEYSESRSMGGADMADRISASKAKKLKPLVLASEIQRLENLEFYIKTIAPDITKSKFSYIGREKINEPFIKKEKIIEKVVDKKEEKEEIIENNDDLDDVLNV
jgi:type IV secretory pathway TraG/TraD family ATPase VirD4